MPKSKKTPSKGGKKERSSSGTARKAKRTKCPEILSDESSSEDEKKGKDESSEEEKESEEEVNVFYKLLGIGFLYVKDSHFQNSPEIPPGRIQ